MVIFNVFFCKKLDGLDFSTAQLIKIDLNFHLIIFYIILKPNYSNICDKIFFVVYNTFSSQFLYPNESIQLIINFKIKNLLNKYFFKSYIIKLMIIFIIFLNFNF